MKNRLPIAFVSCLALGLAPAAAAQSTMTNPDETVSQCPAVHLVLVNGTFDTAPNVDPTSDHGFYAKVATDALDRANEGTIVDKANGVQVPSATQDVAEPSTSANSLWGETTSPIVAPTSVSTDYWVVETTTPAVVVGEKLNESAPTTSVSSQWPGDSNGEQDGSENVQRLARTYITYPATAGGVYIPGVHEPPTADSTSYEQSMETGVSNAKNVLDQIDQVCPNTKVFISGYSQGAQVASTVLRDIGAGNGPIDPDKVAGAALLSDPTREEDSALFATGDTSPAPAPGTSGTAVKQLGALGTGDAVVGGGIAVDRSSNPGSGFGALNSRVASYCIDGDLVCAMPIDSPLPKLATSVGEKINVQDPVGSMRAVAESLGPAVVLGGVEAVADGVSFGNGQFKINRATSANKTLIGRIATEAGRTDRTQGEMEQRLTASLSQLGGMALGAGITIAKKTVTAENLALIAAAGTVGPQAAIAVAAAKLGEASLELITPELVGGASRRVLDEVQAAGFNEETLTTVATQAAQWNNQNAHAGYATAPVTSDGRTAAQAIADWAVALTADAVSGTSRALSNDAVTVSAGSGRSYTFNQEGATDSVAQLLQGVQS